MSTLQEIEKVVSTLSREELDHLEATLRDLRRQQRSGPQRKTNLAVFSGVLRLEEDPLAWQKGVRQEWE